MLVEASSQFHPSEELLEEFSFGRVREPALDALEDHLFVCDQCQAKVEEFSEYSHVWKRGIASYTPRGGGALGDILADGLALPLLTRPATLLAAGFLLAVVSTITLHYQRPAPASVQLTALRGGDDSALPSGPADRPIDLHMKAVTLPPAAGYRIELVNRSGRPIWVGDATRAGVQVSAHVSPNPGPGVYWVRLYGRRAETSQQDLLREFGLRLQ